MGEIIVEEKGKKGGKRQAKKHSTRIDMTPMVDLMCLLITFFMLTTAFSKPKVMVITMPEKTDNPDDKNRPEIPKNRTLNILLTEGHKVYYYIGIADPKKPLEVLRTIHSYDPCLACAIHLVDTKRQEIARVKVL